MSALDNLVKSGKVRYIGFSDARAWKVAQAQVLSSKYTRANGAKMQGLRGSRAGEFTEKQYDIDGH